MRRILASLFLICVLSASAFAGVMDTGVAANGVMGTPLTESDGGVMETPLVNGEPDGGDMNFPLYIISVLRQSWGV